MYRRIFFLLVVTLGLLALTAHPALAHDGEPHSTLGWWTAWTLEPLVIIGLAVTAFLYIRGWRMQASRGGGANSPMKLRAWAFGAGMAALVIALVSPVDALAEELFWVHMLQHNLLMLAAAPLLVISYPLPPMLLGMPEGSRQWIGQRWARTGWLHKAWKWLSTPLVVWLLSAGLLWGWHAPAFYQASVANDTIHAVQHFSFLGSALLFWWVTLHTLGARAANRGTGILYLFTTALHSGLLGALLTFSSRIWYPVYSGRAEQWGLTALADQQLAGTIMWVPSGMIYMFAALWMMKIWLDAMGPGEEPALSEDQPS